MLFIVKLFIRSMLHHYCRCSHPSGGRVSRKRYIPTYDHEPIFLGSNPNRDTYICTPTYHSNVDFTGYADTLACSRREDHRVCIR